MKKITVLDIKFYPHTVRWYRRKKSKQDSTQVSCYDGFAHIETVGCVQRTFGSSVTRRKSQIKFARYIWPAHTT